MKSTLVLYFLLFFYQSFCQHVSVNQVENRLKFLASDHLKGRYPGTPGHRLAGNYIRDQFVSLGLCPMAENGVQAFSYSNSVDFTGSYLEINNKRFSMAEEFYPCVMEGQYYEGLDTSDCYRSKMKIFKPDVDDRNVLRQCWLIVNDEPSELNSLLNDSIADRCKGILILCDDTIPISGNEKAYLTFETSARLKIPAFKIRKSLMKGLLSLKDTASESEYVKIAEDLIIRYKIQQNECVIQDENIVFLLRSGYDSTINKYVVIGAHYDHLGLGGPFSKSRFKDSICIHPGADDNASGVAGLLSVAAILSEKKALLKKNVLFVAFSGEEAGCMGSTYFISDHIVPDSSIVSMINLDMIGRFDKEKKLLFSYGSTLDNDGLQPENVGSDEKMNIIQSKPASCYSDHLPFIEEGIPSFLFTTGLHDCYHKPCDTPENINYKGITDISRFVADFTLALANEENIKIRKEESISNNDRNLLSHGFIPDFETSKERGCRVDLVSDNTPAAMAGLKNGDVIKAVNGVHVLDYQHFMLQIRGAEKGDFYILDIERNGKKKVLLLIF